MYVTKVRLKEAYRNMPADLEIIPEQLTLLVGDQGCGKSSLLELLYQHGKKKVLRGKKIDSILEVELAAGVGGDGVTTYYFDAEKDNPRVKNPMDYANWGIGYEKALACRFASHGEVLRTFTVGPMRKVKDSVVFIDEPESALSIRNQYQLVKSIQAALSQQCQLFVATHCLPLIQTFDRVYSLEHKQWMSSSDFLLTQMQDRVQIQEQSS